jgi:hypothetical protein
MNQPKFDLRAKVLGTSAIALRLASQRLGFDVDYYQRQHNYYPQPDEWADLQTYLNIMHDLRKREGHFMGLIALGQTIPHVVDLPPHLQTLEEIFQNFNMLYHSVHQGNVGQYVVEFVSQTYIRVKAYTPYPSDYEYGLLYGFAHRYLPPETDITVYREQSPSRLQGDDHCIYDLRWQFSLESKRFPGRFV